LSKKTAFISNNLESIISNNLLNDESSESDLTKLIDDEK